jgi:hypothetical protein
MRKNAPDYGAEKKPKTRGPRQQLAEVHRAPAQFPAKLNCN